MTRHQEGPSGAVSAPATPPDSGAPPAPLDGQGSAKPPQQRYEVFFGLALAVFAAVLALNELAGGKYGDDELRMASERTSAYLWYQSKGIKESLAEGQRDLLRALTTGGAIRAEQVGGVEARVRELEIDLTRYHKEKTEILLGSAKVGRENWAQDVEGKLGRVVGVKELEAQLEVLGAAGDRFDLATLFLQICLVLGAVGLLVSQARMKRIFLGAMVAIGSIGIVWSVLGYAKAGLF
ncbi:MAG: DUF4337 domain-containing protein [Polyangiaceae bacterium]|nr:DUF4337 domain-containing protein [Polyangiaceae bacterium]